MGAAHIFDLHDFFRTAVNSMSAEYKERPALFAQKMLNW
jgi:hypothetical protein